MKISSILRSRKVKLIQALPTYNSHVDIAIKWPGTRVALRATPVTSGSTRIVKVSAIKLAHIRAKLPLNRYSQPTRSIASTSSIIQTLTVGLWNGKSYYVYLVSLLHVYLVSLLHEYLALACSSTCLVQVYNTGFGHLLSDRRLVFSRALKCTPFCGLDFIID